MMMLAYGMALPDEMSQYQAKIAVLGRIKITIEEAIAILEFQNPKAEVITRLRVAAMAAAALQAEELCEPEKTA